MNYHTIAQYSTIIMKCQKRLWVVLDMFYLLLVYAECVYILLTSEGPSCL